MRLKNVRYQHYTVSKGVLLGGRREAGKRTIYSLSVEGREWGTEKEGGGVTPPPILADPSPLSALPPRPPLFLHRHLCVVKNTARNHFYPLLRLGDTFCC